MPPTNTFQFTSHSPEQSRQIGNHLGRLLRSGDVICLSGNLGAGKTTFAAGIGEGWGVVAAITSPTFVIVHEHGRSSDHQRLYHIDAYRIGDDDAESIGLEDILDAAGSALIEWPENIASWLPTDALHISLTADGEVESQRRMVFTARGSHSGELLVALVEIAFKETEHAAGD